MKIFLNHIILITVSNYLDAERVVQIRADISKFNRLPDLKFIRIFENILTSTGLKIILSTRKIFGCTITNCMRIIKRKIRSCLKLCKGLLVKPENKVLFPQLKALQEANMILSNLG